MNRILCLLSAFALVVTATGVAAADDVPHVPAPTGDERLYYEIPTVRYSKVQCVFDSQGATCGNVVLYFVCGPTRCMRHSGHVPIHPGRPMVLREPVVVDYADGFSCEASPGVGVMCVDKLGNRAYASHGHIAYEDVNENPKDW